MQTPSHRWRSLPSQVVVVDEADEVTKKRRRWKGGSRLPTVVFVFAQSALKAGTSPRRVEADSGATTLLEERTSSSLNRGKDRVIHLRFDLLPESTHEGRLVHPLALGILNRPYRAVVNEDHAESKGVDPLDHGALASCVRAALRLNKRLLQPGRQQRQQRQVPPRADGGAPPPPRRHPRRAGGTAPQLKPRRNSQTPRLKGAARKPRNK